MCIECGVVNMSVNEKYQVMIKKIFTLSVPHLIAIVAFIVISSAYFMPMFEGKNLQQSDVQGYSGMVKEITDYRKSEGEEPLWTNSMFSGMPAYLISMVVPGNLVTRIHAIINSPASRPACHVFLYMLGFYILLLLFGFSPVLSFFGGIAYGMSSYLLIILGPGHITKAMALGYMPMIIGAVYFAYRKNSLTGALLTSLFLSLQLTANHLQITYYTLLILVIFGIFELIRQFREKQLRGFIKTTMLLLGSAVLAVCINITSLWTVYEYSKFSMRGPAELTSNTEDRTQGLDRSYITAWSYSKGETFNLLIPNFKGGSSGKLFDENSNIFKHVVNKYGQQNAVTVFNQNAGLFTHYWGEQPGTSGPVYLGASLIFLFVLGMFILKGQVKWWLLTATIFSILLSWGRHFNGLTNFLLDYFPLYSKFRTVSMILVIAELTIPLGAVYTLYEIIKGEVDKKLFKKAFSYSLIITGGLCLIFAIAPGVTDLNGPADSYLVKEGLNDWVSKLKDDRAALLSSDAFRSLIFILLTAGTVILLWMNKMKHNIFFVIITLIVLIDLWSVNKRYINDDYFVPERSIANPYIPTEADKKILADKELYFRVYDLASGNPFSSSRASYFHKSIGGYHGAKVRRYQDLVDRYISTGRDSILDMLNTKYLIINDPKTRTPTVIERSSRLGNAWFVSKYTFAENADEEIAALEDLNPGTEMVTDRKFEPELLGKEFITDSSNSISLVSYSPDKLKYSYQAGTDQLTIFSEVYYPEGWKLYVDNKEIPSFRANYVLRAGILPAGKHEAEFIFRPSSYYTGNKIALASSLLLFLSIGFSFYTSLKKIRS